MIISLTRWIVNILPELRTCILAISCTSQIRFRQLHAHKNKHNPDTYSELCQIVPMGNSTGASTIWQHLLKSQGK